MDLSQLRRLVRQFVAGEIQYEAFRAQFVASYLSVIHQDLEIDRHVNAIENVCADFDEGDIADRELRDELSVIANPLIFISVEMTAVKPESRSSHAIYIRHEAVYE